jgi:sulfite reductase beta subunit-like hemoprotein
MKQLLGLALLLTLVTPLAAAAEQAIRFGDIEIHYSAMLTADLQPEVARTYGIERRKSRGIATLAVLRKDAAGVARPIKASVYVSAVNAVGRVAPVAIREIQENAAVYYIGTFRVAEEETLIFKVQIIPDGAEARNFEFKKTFFP